MVLIVANPIYDSVFKALMDKLELARGILSALIGMTIVELRLIPQEHVRKHPESGDLFALRLDFCAIVQTADGRRFQVIIELQKAKFGASPLRFRHYMASRYLSVEELVMEGGETRQVALPIISIYLLGYLLDKRLPMAMKVERRYVNAVTGKVIGKAAGDAIPNEFVEQLTHDAYFIQIPKITGKMGSELERVLCIFDQHRVVKDDSHRLEIDEKVVKADPLLTKVFTTLNRLQESAEMEKLMSLEDVYLLEQKQLADEVRDELRLERKKREEEQQRREEEQKLREEEQKRRKESDKRWEEEQMRREEEQKRREEEQKRREAAEKELARLRKQLDEKNDASE